MRLGAPTNLEKMKQDLGRKCSAWKDCGLGLEISLHSSLRERVKWDLGRAQPKPLKSGTYQEPGSVKFSKTRNRD